MISLHWRGFTMVLGGGIDDLVFPYPRDPCMEYVLYIYRERNNKHVIIYREPMG